MEQRTVKQRSRETVRERAQAYPGNLQVLACSVDNQCAGGILDKPQDSGSLFPRFSVSLSA
jgi:hypothetical protein